MLIPNKFNGYRRDGRRLYHIDMGSDVAAPDYTPVADASKESAEISAQLGREQLAEAKRQYDSNSALAKPVVDAQLEVMKQGLVQGEDYYNYMKEKQRPVEDALQQASLKDTSAQDATERNAIVNAQTGLADKISDVGARQLQSGTAFANDLSGGLRDVIGKYGLSVDEALGRLDKAGAAADALTNSSLARANAAAGKITENSARHEGQINSDIALYTAGNSAIRDKYGADIEQDAALAQADARAGQSNAMNQAIRQAMRYGLNPGSVLGDTSLAAATAQASAANGARTSSTDKYRSIVGEGIGMRQALMSSSNQAAIAAANADLGAAGVGLNAAGQKVSTAQARAGLGMSGAANLADMGANEVATSLSARKAAEDQGFANEVSSAQVRATAPATARDLRINDESRANAKLLDAAGLYRGLSGASTGAYGLAVNAGTAANQNNAAAGQSYLSSMNQSNQTTMQGRQLAMQGLTSILGSQTSAYNAGQQSGGMGGLGSVLGGAASLYTAFSDARLKKDVRKIADDRRGFGWYEFSYTWGGPRHIGVLAQEVEKFVPSAVSEIGGLKAVDYAQLQG